MANKSDYRKYLLPKEVAQLANIEMKAKLVVEGFITGLHRSPYHGFSVEFAEHRQYRPGDEVRHIDWKVFGRTDKYYVKQFEEETNLRAFIAVDSSASMNYKSEGNISKFEYSTYLAGALSYLLIKQRDAVGLAIYDTKVNTFLPSKSKPSYIYEILKSLDSTNPANETGTASALESLAERIKRRGLIIIFSDFFDTKESILKALKHFRHQSHEVLAFMVLDPRELDFKFGYSATFKDLETNQELITNPYLIQKSYSKAVEDYINFLKNECRQYKVDFNVVNTSEPFDKALKEYLIKRSKVQ
jgi:uncharacterized protein (DUF58 family)